MKKKAIFILIGSITLLLVLTIIIICNFSKIKKNLHIGKKDDWVYTEESKKNSYINFRFGYNIGAVEVRADSGEIGFSVGGAKDVKNFRENINANYFPISTDITYEGLFYDYSFNTGKKNESKELFSPSYSYAVSKDPISEKNEYYMTVGLNSNIKQSDFKRKKLNLVIMLDISASMSSSLENYYYDDISKKSDDTDKMKAAEQSINCLIDKLNDDDRFGVVLFDDGAYLGKEMNLVKDTDMEAIKQHILDIKAQGATNFSSGYKKSTELFDKYLNQNFDEYENRIIILTDAMPNLGETSKDGLYSSIKENADKGINTTFVGIGVDFNTQLVEAIGKVRGCNYYSVHKVDEFKKRMGEEFEYMVTPLVYDLKLNFNSDDFEIEQVYGSDSVNKDTGNIININTLFPSANNSEGEVKGGVVLLKLKSKNSQNEMDKKAKLSVLYKDRNGKEYSNEQYVNLKADITQEYYENAGIRKAIVLVRYANTIKNWILYERTGEKRFCIIDTTGIEDCCYTNEQVKYMLGENERASVKLSVSKEYKNTFSKIKDYIQNENREINDSTFEGEIKILDKLINY